MTWFLAAGTSWSSTPTTPWKLITLDSKHGFRPMRGLKTIRSARTIVAGHAFAQNLRRGHYELATDSALHDRLPAAFADLAHCL